MAKNIFQFLKELKTAKKSQKNNEIEKTQKSKPKPANFREFLNKINSFTDEILLLKEPQVFTLAKENNIACKFDKNILLTKDANLVAGIEIKGSSYAGINGDSELGLFKSRNDFFQFLNPNIELNILTKKKKITENGFFKLESKNIYANEITKIWNEDKEFYEIKYYLIFSTAAKKLTGLLEQFKNKATSEDTGESKEYKDKLSHINDSLKNALNNLSSFQPRILNADEILNIYATYSNAEETNFKYTKDLISDCYISSQCEFKKDFIEFTKNNNEKIFARFISVKAYETEMIQSSIATNLLRSDNEFMIFVHTQAYGKEKALKEIKDKKALSTQLIRDELEALETLIKSDRESLLRVSYSIFIQEKSLEKLEETTDKLIYILKNQNLNAVRENLNQKALYFSFFASRGNLNARKKTLKISNLSTIANFENEPSGFNENDWGKEAVTSFEHLTGTPYLFNFHWQEKGDRPSGHTMIIGGTGAGKTTLAQFLMCNLYKYNIDIFSMDKLRGMFNFATYTNGEYHDSETNDFKLNPFSLPYSNDNIEFLKNWLESMANVGSDEHEARNEISQTVSRMFKARQMDDKIYTLGDFIQNLPASNTTNLKMRFENFKNSIFNHEQDALNFQKQLSILNMDGILSNPQLASLTAMYIFHKLKNQAKNNQDKRGFFCFIDELKDYLNDETMREKILEAILEVRKIGGVMCMGFQSISLFKDIKKGSSFLDNIANYIIYPTNNQQAIEEMIEMIGITDSEAKFLMTAGTNSRKVLLKMKLRGESAILNVDLSKLGNYLRVFSSSSDNVMWMKKLQKEYPQEWRDIYINS